MRYGAAGGAFGKAHARFTMEEEAFDWDALRRAPHDRRERERGRKSFVMRALDEQRSLLAFSELLSALCEAGAPIDVIGSLTRVVRDEARHVDLCGRVVDALGGWPDDAPEPAWVRTDPRQPLSRRILTSVIGSLCIGETLSVAMIAGCRKHASDPVVHEVLTRMLADESFHSRFGWWWLELEAPRFTDDDHRFVERWLPKVFGAIEKHARPSAAALADTRPYPYGAFGALSHAEREVAFVSTVTETILPGLARAGIDGEAAWNARPRREA